MNTKSLACAAAGLLLACASAEAVPAKRDLRTVTQPDGTTIKVRRTGDEFRHFLLSEDGMLLTTNPSTGFIEFARMNSAGRIESTGVTASDPGLRSTRQLEAATPLSNSILKSARRSPRRAIAQNGMGRFTGDFPLTGDVKVLIILVNYKDVKCTLSDPRAYFEAMLNEEGFSQYGGTGSCRDYFRDNSLGQFRPQFDLYGPVELPQNRAYYGGNDSYYDEDIAAEDMIVDACKLLDSTVDFSEYDNDGDGYVDNVYVFYAGQGEASYGPDDSVWPHAWNLTSAGKAFKLDGVTISRYACSNEWEQNRPDGIGTFVHEFSHVMGLPDLYCTDYSDAETDTPGSWSVMDYGPYNNDGRTPPAYSIYERNAMTWLEPRLIDDACSITLEDIKSSNDGCIITTSKENEFFLLENRQQSGWDAYVPGHGMLIWHIDYDQRIFDSNKVNNTVSHQYVDIVEANNYPNNESLSAMAGYPWPGTSGATSFTPSTTPAFKEWSGTPINLPLTEIAETDGVITFNVAGGTPLPPPIETPVATEPLETGEDWFLASWQSVAGATDYEVKLYAEADGEPVTVTADMGSGKNPSLPSGWSASAIAGYTSSSNYGQASPSFKLSTDGAWIETARFDTDITSITFWCKGQQAVDSSLEVQGLIDGTWRTLDTFSPENTNVIADASVTNIPEGVRAVKFIWHKQKGNLSIDDIVITAGRSDRLVLTVPSTAGENRYRFTALENGNYFYTVSATDGEYRTPHSAPQRVSLPGTTGINGIDADALPAEYFDMLGRPLRNPAPGTICIERRAGRTTKRIIR